MINDLETRFAEQDFMREDIEKMVERRVEHYKAEARLSVADIAGQWREELRRCRSDVADGTFSLEKAEQARRIVESQFC